MKFIILTVFACFAILAESHPFLGLDAVADLGKKVIGTGLNTAADIGKEAIVIGASVVNGIAKGVSTGLELGIEAAHSMANGVSTGLGMGINATNNVAHTLTDLAQKATQAIEQRSPSVQAKA